MKKISKISETKQPMILSCIFLCSVLLSFLATNTPFRIGNTGTDSSVFSYVARIILKGGMPYRDTFDHKGPLIYLIDALGQLIHDGLGLWFIELAFIFATLVLTYKIAKLMGCNNIKSFFVVIVCMFSIALYFDGGNMVEEYACMFIMLQLYIFMLFFMDKEITPAQLIISGISFGAVCLLRINMISLWIVMCIGVLIKCLKDQKPQMIVKFILWFLTGVCIISVPIIIWLAAGDAFKPFIDDYFSFNFQYSSNSEHGNLIDIIKAIGTFFITPPVILSVIILAFVCIKGRKLFDWLCLTGLILSILMMCMAGHTFLHYGLTFCPLVVYSVSLAMTSEHILQLKILKHKTRIFIGICIAFVLCIIFLYVKGFSFKKITDYVTGAYMDQYFSESKVIAEIIQKNTDKDDKIIVLGNHNIIYLLSHRMSSSEYSYQLPIIEIDTVKKEEFISDINNLNTEIIVTSPNTIVKYLLIDTINDYYTLIDTVGEMDIYKKHN